MNITYQNLEIIVVDNGSEENLSSSLMGLSREIKYIRLEENIGVAGRNIGIDNATGSIVITIDDDVFGLDDKHIEKIISIFDQNKKIGGINFKVLDPDSEDVINWCHPYKSEDYENKYFKTDRISEGAIAFRREVLEMTELYPDYYFISHEGTDLAVQIIGLGYDIIFCPDVVVRHFHCNENRESWRRYYYDTRNQFWLVIRHYPFWWGFKCLSRGISALLIYSIRDGFVIYWLKAVFDAVKLMPKVFKERRVISKEIQRELREINKNKPGIMYMIRKRFFRKGVRI